MKRYGFLAAALLLCLCSQASLAATNDKIAVLITGWGMPRGYNFDYAWTTSDYPRIGDKTEYEGQECKIGHVGEFPYQSHINMIPWAITFKDEDFGTEWYDYHGIYIYDNETDTFYSPNTYGLVSDNDTPVLWEVDNATLTPALRSTITPLKDVKDQYGNLTYPVDPRDGTDYMAGWYRIGAFGNGKADNGSVIVKQFPNGLHDLVEAGPPLYWYLAGIFGTPTAGDNASRPFPAVEAQDEYLKELMSDAFGDAIDLRFGYYTAMAGDATPAAHKTKMEDDVAEEFANDGFRKMIIARETTDNNRYANEFMSGNYVKERLCAIDVLDEMEIYQSRQVGRTPEFNAMNIENLRPFIEQYPEGSTIALVYATRGLTWGKEETNSDPTQPPNPFGAAHPWSKEIYHENAYLNYLSWKRALQKEFGSAYNLVFTKNGVESDNRTDNFYSYALSTDVDLKGYSNEGGKQVYNGTRDAIDMAKASGYDKIIVAPCHWNYDNLDTALRMQQLANLPLTPKAKMYNFTYDHTFCETASGAQDESCSDDNATFQITVAPSYGKLPEEFSTAYFVMLRGAIERFGVYPQGEELRLAARRKITKRRGGRLLALSPLNPVFRSSINIPRDPQPTYPEEFTPENARSVTVPENTNDCLWEDTVMNISWRKNPPEMQAGVTAVGPAVHFGPYRTIFNRDVTVRIPYKVFQALGKEVKPYIYNHVTKQWDAIEPVRTFGGMVVFKTQVLGLFRAGVAE